ncbi:phage tail tape measure protein [Streptomyces sp. NPDC086838]|uniref:phage tail tape measure protein n=1 Tax=Streptomyces sp. NPDC086838 TaxID=3365762 RepID=UPI0037F7537D
MPRAASVWVDILPSMAEFRRELRRSLEEPVTQSAGRAGAEGGESLMSGMKAKMVAGAVAVGAAAGALVVKGLEQSMEKQKATGKLKAQLGLTAQDAKRAGEAAGRLYGDTVTESVDEAAASIRATMSAGLAPPKATTKQLAALGTKVQDLSSLFEVDLGQAANAAGQAVKSGLAKNGAEALDIMFKGFQVMGPRADDLADTFNEYSTIFRSLGIDMKTATGLFSQGMKAGARDTDVVADALKEFQIRTTDGSKASADAFKLLGMNAEKSTAKFAKGGKNASAGLQLVLDKLRNMKDPVDRNAAAVGLFGTKAEDLGQALFKLDPSKAVKDLGAVGGAAQQAGDDLRDNAGAKFESFKRKALMAIGDATAKYVLPRLETFGRYLNSDVLPVVQRFGSFLDTKAVPAVKDLGAAFMAGVGWVKEYGVWFAPLAIAIGGVTLAMSANAIATSFSLGVLGAYSIAVRGVMAVTRAWAAAQALFNSVMALNPITLIVIGVLALGAAAYIAFKKVGWFHDGVMAAWEGIQTGWNWLWNNALKPGFGYLMAGLHAIGTAAHWLWSTVLSPVFSFIATAASILATTIAVVLILPAIVAFKLLAATASWLWSTILSPVFGAIGDAAVWLWTTAIKPSWEFIKAGFQAFGAAASWLWSSVIKPVFGWIGDLAVWLWNQRIKPSWELLKIGVGLVGAKIKDLWTSYVKPALQSIADKAKWLWDKGLKPAFDLGKKGAAAFGDAFKAAKKVIGEQWDKLKDIAKTPIKFIIDHVYNGGIVPTWNAVAGAFGAPKLKKVNLDGWARGGVLPGRSSFRDGDDQLVPMRKGEGVYVSEAMSDPYERARLHAVNKAAMQGRSLSAFRDGAGFSMGGVFGWVKNTASKGVDLAKSGVDWLKDGVKASAEAGLNRVVKPLIEKISGSASAYKDMVTGVPKRMVKTIIGYSDQADTELEKAGVGGKGFAAALRWARTQAGKAYQWGGNGDPSWDCSGFMSAMESVIRGQKPHRRWATGAFSGAQAPAGWVLGAKSPFQIGITNSGVGHTAGTINGVNVESRGGDGVVVGSRARSYMDPLFTDRYGFKGYANGGSPRPGEIAWVGENGPELLRFSGGEVVYSNAESMRMAAGLGPLRGFAKGTSKASAAKAARVRAQAKAQSEIPGDLTSFRKSLTGTASAIQKAADALTKDLAAAGKAGQSLVKSTEKASAKLQSMAKARDAVTAKMKEAKSYAADKASGLADFLGVSNFGDVASVGDLISGLKGRQATAKGFEASLATLQKRGASKDLIYQLGEMGADSKLAGLIAGASTADLKQINALVKANGSLSKAYGNNLADLMYDAGAASGKGFLTGLLAEEKAIQAAMAKLGNGAITAIRSKKGIDAHSPSRKGAQAGADVGAGVVAGMAAMAPTVAREAERLAQHAVPAAALVPVTSGATGRAGATGAFQDGQRLYLVLEDGQVLSGYVSDRVDDALTDVRRAKRSGRKRD